MTAIMAHESSRFAMNSLFCPSRARARNQRKGGYRSLFVGSMIALSCCGTLGAPGRSQASFIIHRGSRHSEFLDRDERGRSSLGCAFRKRFDELGWIDGRNIHIDCAAGRCCSRGINGRAENATIGTGLILTRFHLSSLVRSASRPRKHRLTSLGCFGRTSF